MENYKQLNWEVIRPKHMDKDTQQRGRSQHWPEENKGLKYSETEHAELNVTHETR